MIPARVRSFGVPVGLFLLGVILPLGIAAHYGALGVPRSDDWSYLVSLFRWVDHGRLGFNDWVSMTLVGQLVITMPVALAFHDSITAVHIFSALIGFVGLVALVAVGKRVIPGGRGAVLLAVTLAVGPLWAPLVSTYMTDVPALTAELLSIACVARAFRTARISLGWFTGAVAWGVVAISIRQYQVIPLIALVVVAAWTTAEQRDWRSFRVVLAVAAIAGVGVVVLFAWWAGLPDSLSLTPKSPASGVIANLAVRGGGFLRLSGLLLAPVIVSAGPARIVRRAWAASQALTVSIGAATSIGLVATYARVPDVPFVGNYVARQGVLADDVLLGTRGLVMPPLLFDVLALIGSAGALLLLIAFVPTIVALAGRLRERYWSIADPFGAVLGLSIAGFSAAYAIAIATDLPIFDRYVLPILPLVGLGILRARAAAPLTASDGTRARSLARAGTLGTLVVLGIVGLAFSTDSASFDATRWQVAEAAIHHGYAANQIDAGFEWVSFHRRRGPPPVVPTQKERKQLRRLWLRGLCVDVIVDPLPAQAAHAFVHRSMHGLGHGAIAVIAERNRRGCHA